jgi:hypothetical protein
LFKVGEIHNIKFQVEGIDTNDQMYVTRDNSKSPTVQKYLLKASEFRKNPNRAKLSNPESNFESNSLQGLEDLKCKDELINNNYNNDQHNYSIDNKDELEPWFHDSNKKNKIKLAEEKSDNFRKKEKKGNNSAKSKEIVSPKMSKKAIKCLTNSNIFTKNDDSKSASRSPGLSQKRDQYEKIRMKIAGLKQKTNKVLNGFTKSRSNSGLSI